IYTSLESINGDVQKIIADINTRSFQHKSDIRRTRQYAFDTYDKPHMKPLPNGNYAVCDYKYFLHVPDNYHLEYDGHYYSVLYTYHKHPAVLKATMSEIRICDANGKLLCRHPRSYKDFPRYITDPSHMPTDHVYYRELNQHDGAYYRRWATVYGEAMSTLIDRVLRSQRHEEQAYNSCKGILHLCDEIPKNIVSEAAETCIKASACRYSYFKKVLDKLVNRPKSIRAAENNIEHANIRGKESYQ
ncbi:MAG: transposase, partial [Lachnospiraceae bacterium]|nr:transposase [Lachnospiraceae bacterium]